MANYKGIDQNTLRFLSEYTSDKINSIFRNRSEANYYLSNNTRPWMSIFVDYLTKANLELVLRSDKIYLRQSDLDDAYPNNTDSTYIIPPFSFNEENRFEIMFIDTSTGNKVYDYLNSLVKDAEGYKDLPSLAVALTDDKFHKVKIVRFTNTVFILTNKLSSEFVEKALALFPFYFEIQELLTNQNIMNCCQAVSKEEPLEKPLEFLIKDLENIKLQKSFQELKNVLNTRRHNNISEITRQIASKQSSITTYEDQLQHLFIDLEELQLKRLGLETTEDVGDETVTEVIDFMKRNPYITDFNIDTTGYGAPQLCITCVAPITMYESEPLERIVKNTVRNNEYSTSYREILSAFNRIFVEEELTMTCETVVRISLERCDVDGSRSASNMSYSDFKWMHQPHISRFNCWGDNKNSIRQALREGDLLKALTRITAAVQNVNFTDSTVLNNWISAISDSPTLYNLKTCKSKADGKMWSISDIIEQLRRENVLPKEHVDSPTLVDEIPF